MASNRTEYILGFSADTQKAESQLANLQKTLSQIQKMPFSLVVPDKQIQQASKAAKTLSMELIRAKNSSGNLDLSKFLSGLNDAGTSLKKISNQLILAGKEGEQAFSQLTQSLISAEAPVRNIGNAIKDWGKTLKNTIKWELSSNIVHGLESSFSSAINYAKDLNSILTNIRVVTGQSVDEVSKFAIEANKAAKALSTTTKDYANASLIYFQQGDDTNTAMQKAAITTKAANVAFSASAKEMSEMLTAVWNSYQVGENELERYVDIMAKLGATTATSTEEIATAMQKVAATANTVGVSMEQMSSIIATVSSVTREAPESIGTAYKTILARAGDLKLGETLEDGVTFKNYSKQLQQVGISVTSASGEMRQMGDVIEEIGGKWQTLGSAQKTALAQVLGGTRQYTQVMALFENWDKYLENLTAAKNAEGTLQKQADIWADSWQAASNRIQASIETLYQQLVNDKTLTKVSSFIATIIDGVGVLSKNLGGLPNLIALIGSKISSSNINLISTRISEIGTSIKELFTPISKKTDAFAQSLREAQATLKGALDVEGISDAQRVEYSYNEQIFNIKAKMMEMNGKLSNEQITALKQEIVQLESLRDTYIDVAKQQEKFSQAKKDASAESLATSIKKTIQAKTEDITKSHRSELKGNELAKFDQGVKYVESFMIEDGLSKSLQGAETLGSKVEGILNQMKILQGTASDITVTDLISGLQKSTEQAKILEKIASEIRKNYNKEYVPSAGSGALETKSFLLNAISIAEQRGGINENAAKSFQLQLDEAISADGAEVNAKAFKELLDDLNTNFTNAARKAEENSDTLKSALEGAFPDKKEEIEAFIEQLKRGAIETENAADKADAALKKFQKETEKKFKGAGRAITAFTEIATGLMSIVSTFNAVKTSLATVFDDSASAGERFTAVLTTCLALLQGVSAAVSITKTVFTGNNIVTAIGTAVTKALTKEKATETAAHWANVAAITAESVAFLGIIAVIGLVVLAIYKLIKYIKEYKSAEEKYAEAQKKLVEEQKQLEVSMAKVTEDMASLRDVINDTSLSYEEQYDQINKIINAYGIYATKLEIVSKNYASIEKKARAAMLAQYSQIGKEYVNNLNEQVQTTLDFQMGHGQNSQQIQIAKNAGINRGSTANAALALDNKHTLLVDANGNPLDIGVLTGQTFSTQTYNDINGWYSESKEAQFLKSPAMQAKLEEHGYTFVDVGRGIRPINEEIVEYSTTDLSYNLDDFVRGHTFQVDQDNLDNAIALWEMLTSQDFEDFYEDQTGESLPEEGYLSFLRDQLQWLKDTKSQFNNARQSSSNLNLLYSLYSDEDFDFLNLHHPQGPASVMEVQKLLNDASTSSKEALNYQSREYLLNEISAYDQYQEAADKLSGLNDLAYQKAVSSTSVSEMQKSLNGDYSSSAVRQTIQKSQDSIYNALLQLVEKGTMEIEDILLLTSEDINEDGTISKEVQEMITNYRKATNAKNKIDLYKENKDLFIKSDYEADDYNSLLETGLFKNAKEVQEHMAKSASRRLIIYETAIAELTQDYQDNLTAEKDKLLQLQDQYNDKLDDWYKNFNVENPELSNHLTFLENAQSEWKKGSTESYEDKSGEKLYLTLQQDRASLAAEIEKMKQQIELSQNLEWDTKESKDRKEMLAAFNITEDKGKDTTTWIISALKENAIKIEAWGKYLDQYDIMLSEGDALVEGLARYSEMLNEAETNQDFLDWWEKVGKLIYEAKDKVEQFNNAMKKQGKLTADELAALTKYDTDAISNYNTLSTDEWVEYCKNKSLEYYDQLMFYYREDEAMLAQITNDKKAIMDEYNDYILEQAEQAVEEYNEEWSKINDNIANARDSLANFDFENATFESIIKLKQDLEDAGMELKDINALIDKIIDKNTPDKTKAAEMARAQANLALEQLANNYQKQQQFRSLQVSDQLINIVGYKFPDSPSVSVTAVPSESETKINAEMKLIGKGMLKDNGEFNNDQIAEFFEKAQDSTTDKEEPIKVLNAIATLDPKGALLNDDAMAAINGYLDLVASKTGTASDNPDATEILNAVATLATAGLLKEDGSLKEINFDQYSQYKGQEIVNAKATIENAGLLDENGNLIGMAKYIFLNSSALLNLLSPRKEILNAKATLRAEGLLDNNGNIKSAKLIEYINNPGKSPDQIKEILGAVVTLSKSQGFDEAETAYNKFNDLDQKNTNAKVVLNAVAILTSLGLTDTAIELFGDFDEELDEADSKAVVESVRAQLFNENDALGNILKIQNFYNEASKDDQGRIDTIVQQLTGLTLPQWIAYEAWNLIVSSKDKTRTDSFITQYNDLSAADKTNLEAWLGYMNTNGATASNKFTAELAKKLNDTPVTVFDTTDIAAMSAMGSNDQQIILDAVASLQSDGFTYNDILLVKTLTAALKNEESKFLIERAVAALKKDGQFTADDIYLVGALADEIQNKKSKSLVEKVVTTLERNGGTLTPELIDELETFAEVADGKSAIRYLRIGATVATMTGVNIYNLSLLEWLSSIYETQSADGTWARTMEIVAALDASDVDINDENSPISNAIDAIEELYETTKEPFDVKIAIEKAGGAAGFENAIKQINEYVNKIMDGANNEAKRKEFNRIFGYIFTTEDITGDFANITQQSLEDLDKESQNFTLSISYNFALVGDGLVDLVNNAKEELTDEQRTITFFVKYDADTDADIPEDFIQEVLRANLSKEAFEAIFGRFQSYDDFKTFSNTVKDYVKQAVSEDEESENFNTEYQKAMSYLIIHYLGDDLGSITVDDIETAHGSSESFTSEDFGYLTFEDVNGPLPPVQGAKEEHPVNDDVQSENASLPKFDDEVDDANADSFTQKDGWDFDDVSDDTEKIAENNPVVISGQYESASLPKLDDASANVYVSNAATIPVLSSERAAQLKIGNDVYVANTGLFGTKESRAELINNKYQNTDMFDNFKDWLDSIGSTFDVGSGVDALILNKFKESDVKFLPDDSDMFQKEYLKSAYEFLERKLINNLVKQLNNEELFNDSTEADNFIKATLSHFNDIYQLNPDDAEWVANARNEFMQTIVNEMENHPGSAQTLLNQLVETFGLLRPFDSSFDFDSLVYLGKMLMLNIKEGMQEEAANDFLSFLEIIIADEAIFNALKEKFQAEWSPLTLTVDFGRMLIQGIEKGMSDENKSSFEKSIKNLNLDEEVYDSFADILQTHSPSELTEYFGRMLIQGLEKGFSEEAQNFDVNSDLNILEKNIIKGFTDLYKNIDTSVLKNNLFNTSNLPLDLNGQLLTSGIRNLRISSLQEVLENNPKFEYLNNPELQHLLSLVANFKNSNNINKNYGFDLNSLNFKSIDPNNSADEINEQWGQYLFSDYIDPSSPLSYMKARSFNDLEKALLTVALKEAKSELEKSNKNLEKGTEKYNQAILDYVEKYLDADQNQTVKAIETTWGSLQDTWVSMLTKFESIDKQTAQKTLDNWTNTFTAIAEAYEAILGGKTISQAFGTDLDKTTALVRQLIGNGKSLPEINDILNSNDSKTLKDLQVSNFIESQQSGMDKWIEATDQMQLLNWDTATKSIQQTSYDEYLNNLKTYAQNLISEEDQEKLMIGIGDPINAVLDKYQKNPSDEAYGAIVYALAQSGVFGDEFKSWEIGSTPDDLKKLTKDNISDTLNKLMQDEGSIFYDILKMVESNLILTKEEFNDMYAEAIAKQYTNRQEKIEAFSEITSTQMSQILEQSDAISTAMSTLIDGKSLNELDSATQELIKQVFGLSDNADITSLGFTQLSDKNEELIKSLANLSKNAQLYAALMSKGYTVNFDDNLNVTGATKTETKNVSPNYDTSNFEKQNDENWVYRDETENKTYTITQEEYNKLKAGQSGEITVTTTIDIADIEAIATGNETVDSGLQEAADRNRKNEDMIAQKYGFDNYNDWEATANVIRSIADKGLGYSDTLNDEDREDAIEVVKELAKETSRYNRAIDDVSQGYAEWKKVLKDFGKDTAASAKTTEKLRKAYADLLDLEDGSLLSDDFLQDVENLELMKEAIDGNVDALYELGKRASISILKKLGIDDPTISEYNKQIDEITNNIKNLNAGDLIDTNVGNYINELFTNMIAAIATKSDDLGMALSTVSNMISDALQINVPEFELEKIELEDAQQNFVPGEIRYGYRDGEYVPLTTPLVPGETASTYTAFYRLKTKDGKAVQPTKASAGVGKKNSSGGGGGGGGKPSKQERKPLEKEVERYYNITNQLSYLSKELDKISKLKDRAFGLDKVKLLNEETAALEDQIEKQKEYVDEISEYLNLVDKTRAIEIGATFDEDGVIKNYDDLLEKMVSEYNSKADYYSTVKDESLLEQWEEYQKEWDANKEWLDKYKETNDLYLDELNNLFDMQNQLSSQRIEKLAYEVEYKLNINDKDLELIEYYQTKWEEDLVKSGERMIGYLDAASLYYQNLATLNKELNDLTDLYVNKKITESGFEEELENIQNSIQENIENLNELEKNLAEAYSDVLDMYDEEIQKSKDIMSSASEQLSTYVDLLGSMGRGQNFKELSKFYDSQYNTQMKILTSQKQYLDSLREELKAFEAKDELTKLEQDEYDALIIKIGEVNSTMLSDTQACLDAVRTIYDNTINYIFQMLDTQMGLIAEDGSRTLSELAASYEYYTSEQERYVASSRQMYENAKMNRQIEDAIAGSTTRQSKELLKALQERINLQDEVNRLTQYDLDMNELQYQLALKKIALEEAQNAKDTVQLTRDLNGNYIYRYTANEDALAQKQQEYEDVLQQINDLAMERQSELESQYLQAEQNYYDKAREIAEDDELTREQKQEHLLELATQMEQEMLYLQEQYEIANSNLLISNSAISEYYGESLIRTASQTAAGINAEMKTVIGNTDNIIAAFKAAVDEGGSIWEALDSFYAGVDAVSALSEMTPEMMAESIDTIGKYVVASEQAIDELITTMDTEFDEITSVTDAWNSQATAIDAVIAKYEKLNENIVGTIKTMADLDNSAYKFTAAVVRDSDPVTSAAEDDLSHLTNHGIWNIDDPEFAADDINLAANSLFGGKGIEDILTALTGDIAIDRENSDNQLKILTDTYGTVADLSDKYELYLNILKETQQATVENTNNLILDADALFEQVIEMKNGVCSYLADIKSNVGIIKDAILEQNVTITASFPNVVDSIEALRVAFEDAPLRAAQAANPSVNRSNNDW